MHAYAQMPRLSEAAFAQKCAKLFAMPPALLALFWRHSLAAGWQLHADLRTLKSTLVLMTDTSLFTSKPDFLANTTLERATWEYFPSNCYHLNSRSPSSKRKPSHLYNLVQMVKVFQVTGLIMSRLKNRQTRDTKLKVSGIFFCRSAQYSQCLSTVPKFSGAARKLTCGSGGNRAFERR